MGEAVLCRYSEEGSGPAVVMVHGIGARRSLWQPLMQRLAPFHRCIAYDLRGHGDSPCPPVPYALDDLVRDLEALRAHLGIDRMHVVGHSLGGMIGPAYARAYPDRVLSLGLLSTAAFRTAEDSARVQGVVAGMRKNGVANSLDVLVARWFTDAFAAANPQAIARRRQQVLDTPEEVFLSVFDIYATTEMAPWLGEVAAPSLVLTGEEDGGCPPRLNAQIAAALPDAGLAVLPNLRHAVLIEAPEQVADRYLAFLQRFGQESHELRRAR
jgi:pimeloyl-ACP methyl ester carboxylesterase